MSNDSPKSFDTIRKSLDQSLSGQDEALAPTEAQVSSTTPTSEVAQLPAQSAPDLSVDLPPVGPKDLPNPADYPVSYQVPTLDNQPTSVLPVDPDQLPPSTSPLPNIPVPTPSPYPVPNDPPTVDPLFGSTAPQDAGTIQPGSTNPLKRDLAIVGIILLILMLIGGAYGGYLYAIGEGVTIFGYSIGGKSTPTPAITTSIEPSVMVTETVAPSATPSTSPTASSKVIRSTNKTNKTPTPTPTPTSSATATVVVPSEEPIITPPPPPS